MAPNKPAVDFNAIVQAERRRRKNETTAQKMFDRARGRSASGGVKSHRSGTAPSIASRTGPIGISKRSHSTRNRPRRSISGARVIHSDEEWKHNPHRLKKPPARSSNSSIGGPRMVRSNFNERKFTSDKNVVSSPALYNQFNIAGSAKPAGDLSIRGLAGPYTVIVKNLATGTTAADIESAMAPVGGLVLSCRLVAEQPKVIAEIIFETKEGADNIVETFNNQSADGNILHVYQKIGSYSNNNAQPIISARQIVTPRGPRADILPEHHSEDSQLYGDLDIRKLRGRSSDRYKDYNRENIVDGSYGFGESMDVDNRNDEGKSHGLYSDNLIDSKYKRRSRGDGDRNYR